ncbi:Bacteriorhodopsin related protein [Halalkaliarchaeum sp. AArc-CO]|uniref:Brp/Blh family beta-carotene 15,15'-dioxygenase n=1 Tax=unclassified Halalkaliarchaeum TaxID=2678344 RepID=UPI00217DD9BB|nr:MULTISPECIES: Brp/Blh family beta-carotene 15,15'-dioxygenase [unclassified Halalkaliarchaeum]MDR5672505.1 Brp/Blh family beta-carotene 15,15'-dioxygenase [Halalkaliarchaeum sp. AArc-GB]UWG50545.1 Bacteriorhodopsin related protein [Halalkaliarchaeum sp. AArc-CO]
MATDNWTASGRLSTSPEHLALQLSRGTIGALTVGFVLLSVAGRGITLQTQLLVYLVGMVALNLPHGGYEHFSNLRNRGPPFGARYVVLYVGFVVAFVALFLVAPVVALAFAFATAVAKGGHGDLHVMEGLIGTGHLDTRFQRGLAAFVRGGAVMIVPLVFWPETFYTFSEYMVAIFDPGALAAVAGGFERSRLVLGGGFGLAVVAHLGLGYARGGVSREWLVDAGETLLLVAYFAFVPVVVAIGLYFPLWYSLRQAGRSVAVERRNPGRNDGLAIPVAWGVLVVGALATALVAAGLYVVAPNPLGGAALLPGIVAFYTVFVCVIALPHVVVGEWLDMKRGIWYVP